MKAIVSFSKNRPLLFSNLAALGLALANVIIIFICGGFDHRPEFSLFIVLLLFLLSVVLHAAILLFLEIQLIKTKKFKPIVELFKKEALLLFFAKLKALQDTEKTVFLCNLLWLILAICYFLLAMKVRSYGVLRVDNGPFYIFKIQLFFGVATFVSGYGYKYLLQK